MPINDEFDLADSENDGEKCEAFTYYHVSGCGISVIVPKGDEVMKWVNEIVARGGVPVVEKL